MTRAAWAAVLGLALAVAVGAGCGRGSEEAEGPAPPVTRAAPAAQPRVRVDPTMAPGTIAVDGDPVVGATLTARVASDVAGRIEYWTWHRCIQVPSCQTLAGEKGPSHVVSEEEAWQTLRVIAVRGDVGRGPPCECDVVVGPVRDPDPEPYTVTRRADPSAGLGLIEMVGPGRTSVTVTAPCPVVLTGAVKVPRADGGFDTEGFLSDEEPEAAERHEVVSESRGGQLVLLMDGDCDEATVTIAGAR